MTVDTSMSAHVLAIAQDVFAAMIDGEPGGIQEGWTTIAEMAEPWHAWVDVRGLINARAVVTAERPTCDAIARGLLSMGEDEVVDHSDLVDAFGEVANVVGGNLKSLIADSNALTLPSVAPELPGTSGSLQHEVCLIWQGRPLVISIWSLSNEEGEVS